MKGYSKDTLDCYWSSEKKIIHEGTAYRVGKMSYEDYFFEPGDPKGETEPFNKGTLWLRKDKNDPTLYIIDE
ncbi:MAG TPA: hypothetical protein VNG51_18000 [Ktedonobacteraceae bacterium]|nr:hypothetical protein [Ktedonobacteraceae bacterium]